MSTDRTVTALYHPGFTLTLTISGTGNGSVYSFPSGSIACSWPPQEGVCTTTQSPNSSLKLTAVPDSISIFGGWSGACTNSTGDCTVSLTTNKSVTATFTAAPKAMIGGTGYTSLSAAYGAATNNAEIMLLDTELSESLIMNKGIAITLKGGYHADFNGRSGNLTAIRSPLTVETDRVEVDGLKVK